MGEIIVLKDPVINDPFSKINNFTYEWIKWVPYVKIAPVNYSFSNDDVIVVNICDASDPCTQYNINPKCSKIGIVHKINEQNLKIMNACTYLIYLNPVIESIAMMVGIQKPHHTCPRYPLYDFNGTEVTPVDFAYFGGWFNDTEYDEIHDHIVKLDSKIPKKLIFNISYTWGNSDTRLKKIKSILDTIITKKEINNRHIIAQDTPMAFPIMLFKTRISTYGALHSNLPSIEEAYDLINSKDLSILNYSIGESSMLAAMQSSHTNIVCDDHIDFISYYNETSKYTYTDFAKDFTYISKKYLLN